jgi:hypothetical protein
MEFGTPLFNEFSEAYSNQNGPRLSLTLSPEIPTEKLRKIWRSQNAHDIKSALKRGLKANSAVFGGLSNEEVQGWVDVYEAYWKAVGQILTARESRGDNNEVSVYAIQAREGFSASSGVFSHCAVLLNFVLIDVAVVAVGVDRRLHHLEKPVEPVGSGLPELWL